MKHIAVIFAAAAAVLIYSSLTLGAGNVRSYDPGPSLVTNPLYPVSVPIETTYLDETEPYISDDELKLLGQLVIAEAEGEPEDGKRLVIDTVLNRVDSPDFPDTISEVIFQKNQFSCISNGRFDRCRSDSDTEALIADELKSRTDSEVIFFNAYHWSIYGTPVIHVGNHYFSK